MRRPGLGKRENNSNTKSTSSNHYATPQPGGPTTSHPSYDANFVPKVVTLCVIFVCVIVAFLSIVRYTQFSGGATSVLSDAGWKGSSSSGAGDGSGVGAGLYNPMGNNPHNLYNSPPNTVQNETAAEKVIEHTIRNAMYYQHLGMLQEAAMSLDLAIHLVRGLPLESKNHTDRLAMLLNQRGVVLMLQFTHVSAWETRTYRGVNYRTNPLLNPLDPLAAIGGPHAPVQPAFIPRIATAPELLCSKDTLVSLVTHRNHAVPFTLRNASHLLDEAILYFRCCGELAPLAAQCLHNSALGFLAASIMFNTTRFLGPAESRALKAMELYGSTTNIHERSVDAYTSTTSKLLDVIHSVLSDAESSRRPTLSATSASVQGFRTELPGLLHGSLLETVTTEINPIGGYVPGMLGVHDDDDADAIFRQISGRPRMLPRATAAALMYPTSHVLNETSKVFQLAHPSITAASIATLNSYRKGATTAFQSLSCRRYTLLPLSNLMYCETEIV
eukprot:PhF_6_TR20473/c0_g1_i1/m.29457